jgi:hypothetical protein
MDDKIKHEQIIEEYRKVKEKYKKTTMCYYHWQGGCVFSRRRCKFAHGVVDLKRYPRELFLSIKKSFFMLKGEVYEELNPEGVDPNPKESKIDELIFSSDEEDIKLFIAKSKTKTKEDHDKIKRAKQYQLVEFALLLFKESNTSYIRRDLIEQLFSDVKLRYDNRLLTEKRKVVFQKAATLIPNSQERFQVILRYPTLEQIIPLLANFIGHLSKIMTRKYKFPVHCQEFEKIYHDELTLDLPELKVLRELFNTKTNVSLIHILQNNNDIIFKVKEAVGEEAIKEGFLMEECCSPIEKAKLVSVLRNVCIGEYNMMKELCNKICYETFQHFVSKDKPLKAVMSSVEFKQIFTGTGSYFIRSRGEPKKSEALLHNIKHCSCKDFKWSECEFNTQLLEESKLTDILIDGKILWVHNTDTLLHAISITKETKEIAVDLEGDLSVTYLINRREE